MSIITAIKNPLVLSAPDGIPGEDDLTAINSFAAVNIPPESLFVLPVVMANRNMSSYCIRMGDSTLRNFATGGVGTPVHVMHDRLIRAMGTVYATHFDEVTGEVRAAEYIVRGRVIKDAPALSGGREITTNQEISDIQQGIRRAVSVGPGGAYAEHICEMCNKPVMSWYYTEDGEGCRHIPGMKYDGVYATCRLENGELVELSHVDSGAIGGALIGRAGGNGGTILDPANFANNAPNFSAESIPSKIPPSLMTGGFSFKANALFRSGRISPAIYKEWLDVQGLADETRTISVPKTRSLNMFELQKFFDSLKNRGVSVPESVVTQANSGDVNGLSEFVAGLTSSPVVPVFAQAGVTTPEQARKVLNEAENGRAYATSVNDRLQKAIIRRFGKENSEAKIKTYSVMPVTEQEVFAKEFEAEANEKFGMGKAADDERTPAKRVSRETPSETYAEFASSRRAGKDEDEEEEENDESLVFKSAATSAKRRFPVKK